MFLCLFVELCIVTEERLDRLFSELFFTAPFSVGDDHLTELSSVISEVVDTECVVSGRVVKLVDSVTYDCTSDVTDVERLCDIRGRILHYYLAALSDIGSSVGLASFVYIVDEFFGEECPVDKEINIGVYVFDFCEGFSIADALGDVRRDQRRGLAKYLRKPEARKSVIPLGLIRRDLYPSLDLIFAEPQALVVDRFCYQFFIICH